MTPISMSVFHDPGSKGSVATAVDTSASIKLMQVSISDLCPFFCSPSDLEGKNFK